MPLVRVEPVYPPRALAQGVEGWALVEFTITPAGTTKDVKAVESQPPGIFDAAVVKPSVVEVQPESRSRHGHRTPRCPHHAQLQDVEMRTALWSELGIVGSPVLIGERRWFGRGRAVARPKTRKKAPRVRVDARTGKRLNEAIDDLQAGTPAGGAQQAREDQPESRLALRGESRRAALRRDRSGRREIRLGARAPDKAVASGGLNDAEASSARFQIAKLHLAEEHWKEGIAVLEEWFAAEPNPNSAAYYTLAAAYYQLDNADAALEPAQKAVDLAGDNPQEAWLQLCWRSVSNAKSSISPIQSFCDL